jgi:chemosensory pili system protein ChpA (sensor histidine kinase/response regulator)
MGGGVPEAAEDAVASLATLETALLDDGWERVEEPHDLWYAYRFCRPRVPLTQRIAPYHADGALIAFVEPGIADEPRELDPVMPGPMAEAKGNKPPKAKQPSRAPRAPEREAAKRQEEARLKAERLEAERIEAERLEAERLESERLEAERLEAERLEAERLEAERLEAERREAERREAERLEAERREAERREAERLEAERRETERLDAERLDRERAEADRVEAEEQSPLRDLITSYSAGYDRQVDVRRIYSGTGPVFDPDRFARKYRRRRN